MTRAISLETLKELNLDGFMTKCCLCGGYPPQWHHNLIYGGRQVDAPFAVLPLCRKCHSAANEKKIREKLDWIMCNRATDDQLQEYSKVVNWVARKKMLNEIYGKTNLS